MTEVSVIIPNYNHAAFLKSRIESVLQQSFVNFEIIIMDDASTDNSKEIIELYRNHPKISQIIYNKTNSGSPFMQWAKGIALAKSNWIWIAESDDTAEQNFLAELIEIAHKYPDATLIYSDALVVNVGKKYLNAVKFSEIKNNDFYTDKWNKDYVREGNMEMSENLGFINTVNNASSAILKKKILEEYLKEIKKYIYCGDWFSYLVLIQHGLIAYKAKPLCTVRMHDNSFLIHSNDYNKRKGDYFRILCFLLKNMTEIRKGKLIWFFTEQYLNFGLSSVFKTVATYVNQNFFLALNVLTKVLWLKIYPRKIKQYFN